MMKADRHLFLRQAEHLYSGQEPADFNALLDNINVITVDDFEAAMLFGHFSRLPESTVNAIDHLHFINLAYMQAVAPNEPITRFLAYVTTTRAKLREGLTKLYPTFYALVGIHDAYAEFADEHSTNQLITAELSEFSGRCEGYFDTYYCELLQMLPQAGIDVFMFTSLSEASSYEFLDTVGVSGNQSLALSERLLQHLESYRNTVKDWTRRPDIYKFDMMMATINKSSDARHTKQSLTLKQFADAYNSAIGKQTSGKPVYH